MSDRATLIGALRDALVALLSQGTWKTIEADHRRVGLGWRPELEPGFGKPKYVRGVLADIAEDDLVALGRRCLDLITERSRAAVQDAIWWLDANGIASVSEITRRAIARMLEGHIMVMDESPGSFIAKCAGVSPSWTAPAVAYGDDGGLYQQEFDLGSLFGSSLKANMVRVSLLSVLEEAGFFEWPDKRVFLFLEQLVHPVVRHSEEEQREWVGLLNQALDADGLALVESGRVSRRPIFSVQRQRHASARKPKNLIFASTGPKPELGFRDAIDNDIVLLKHGEHCLVYEDEVPEGGLTWGSLTAWWAQREQEGGNDPPTRRALGQRLLKSIQSPVERLLFEQYFRQFAPTLGDQLPALIPQVYLHYDPVTLRELRRRGEERRFLVQRMDFLLLLRDYARVVIEVDGQQHYAVVDDGVPTASPALYADTVKADRTLRLAGYEVYRFGGHELTAPSAGAQAVGEFFSALFRRHGIGGA